MTVYTVAGMQANYIPKFILFFTGIVAGSVVGGLLLILLVVVILIAIVHWWRKKSRVTLTFDFDSIKASQ